jgi:hypothetical protein
MRRLEHLQVHAMPHYVLLNRPGFPGNEPVTSAEIIVYGA